MSVKWPAAKLTRFPATWLWPGMVDAAICESEATPQTGPAEGTGKIQKLSVFVGTGATVSCAGFDHYAEGILEGRRRDSIGLLRELTDRIATSLALREGTRRMPEGSRNCSLPRHS
jgi:hypothetical protein